MRALSSLLRLLAIGNSLGVGAVTIYTTFTTDASGQRLQPTNTNTATGPAYTGYTAYNLTTLTPPALPNPLPSLNFSAQLYASGATGLSIRQKGSFMGLSIELSVIDQFLGRNSTRLNPPFLNYINNIKVRAGQGVPIRVGGNTQQLSQLYFTPFNDHYRIINKTVSEAGAMPSTTEVDVYIDLLYTLLNITQLTSTQWYLGLPFGYPLNITGIVEMVKTYEEVLGDNLIALQLGNEPDLFGYQDRQRPFAYPIPTYLAEYTNVTQALLADPGITRERILLAPSTCCNTVPNWTITDVLDAGLLTDYKSSVSMLSVQRYPEANCFDPLQVTDLWPTYLRHDTRVVDVLTSKTIGYPAAAAAAVAANIPFLMFETNTASCAGFPGLSDSFGATLWAVDWAMQLAYQNFSQALFHFGGHDSAYNAFTPPPSNWSSIYQWTTGAIYYSMLMVAETLGASNASQVIDLNLNNSPFTPGYAVYENGVPQKVLLINYMDDLGTGSAEYTAYVQIGGGTTGAADTTPKTVQVRYLAAPSVSEKFNITWAGQSMGGQFEGDGILRGGVITKTVTCSSDIGCAIQVPAPGAALVFMSSQAEDEATNTALSATFPTTVYAQGGPTVGQGVLQTSNGRGGPADKNRGLAATSHGRENSAMRVGAICLSVVTAAAVGAIVVGGVALGV